MGSALYSALQRGVNPLFAPHSASLGHGEQGGVGAQRLGLETCHVFHQGIGRYARPLVAQRKSLYCFPQTLQRAAPLGEAQEACLSCIAKAQLTTRVGGDLQVSGPFPLYVHALPVAIQGQVRPTRAPLCAQRLQRCAEACQDDRQGHNWGWYAHAPWYATLGHKARVFGYGPLCGASAGAVS